MEQDRVRRALVILGGFLFAAGLAGMAWTAWLIWRPAQVEIDPQPQLTTTPFLPQALTATVPAPTATQPPVETPQEQVSYLEFAGLHSSADAGAVKIWIEPPSQVNSGRAIKLAFTPGSDCAYGTGRACVSTHRGGQVTLLTIHSGLGGEGEAFRSAVEGTGLNMAFFSLERIVRNMDALTGVPVRLQVGGADRDDLLLAAVVRIPPSQLEPYFNQPFDDALETAAQGQPVLQTLLDESSDLLAFEICGWQLPGEPYAEGVTPTTGSMYLGFIRVR
jgi:hypothetical protein